ncbi:hypothetical protein [Nocardia sp. NPDC058666]|uniref:hypothetical protein n=1 Tax=Nocardia sp. NPDC058666 TaxID=3346587 RepID=UPI00366233B7
MDADIYYAAAKNLTALADEISAAVIRDLAPGLSASPGMGGNYPAVAPWCLAYLVHANDVRTVLQNYTDAARHFGDIVNAAGYNWDTAEFNANRNPEKGAAPPHPVRVVAPTAVFPQIPVVSGENGAGAIIAPAGQSSSSWTGAPNGRAAALETTGLAWENFGYCQELMTAPSTLRAVRDSFNGVQAPEVPDIQEALDVLRSAAEQIRTVATTLGSETRIHGDNLVAARQQLSTAAARAFPNKPAAQIVTTVADSSIHVSVSEALGADDIAGAEAFMSATLRNSTLFAVFSKVGRDGQGFVADDALNSLPKLKAIIGLPLISESGNQKDNEVLSTEWDKTSTWTDPAVSLAAVDLSALDAYGPQMKTWAILAVKYGNEAGVDPRMVLAMALQEGAPLRSGLNKDFYKALEGDPSSYKPLAEGPNRGAAYDQFRYDLSRQGVDKGHGAGNSIGLTNQKEAPFLETKARYPGQFKDDEWSDLIGNDDLALKSAAYNLKTLQEEAATHATPEVRASQPLNQFLSSGYNAGGTAERSYNVATGSEVFHNGADGKNSEIEHGESTVKPGGTFDLANKILCGSGAFR